VSRRARDQWKFVECVYCGREARTTDHVRPKGRGGSNDEGNLVPSCGPCNSGKGSKLLTEWDVLKVAHGVLCDPRVKAEWDRLAKLQRCSPLVDLPTREGVVKAANPEDLFKGTWEMSKAELAMVFADHFRFTVRLHPGYGQFDGFDNWIYDPTGKCVARGWGIFADMLTERGWIEEGAGVHWTNMGHAGNPDDPWAQLPDLFPDRCRQCSSDGGHRPGCDRVPVRVGSATTER